MAYQGKFSQPRNTEENIRLRAEAQKKEAAEKKLPAAAQAPAPKAPKAVDTAPVKKNGKRKKKKANRTVTLVFYTFYFVLVAAGLAGIFFLHSWLNNYLTKYEASQPTTKCAEIFRDTFSDPNWEALYAKAGIEDTEYEGSEAFAAYMDAKLEGKELTYVETSAGLSGGHKYLLKLDNETIGYFTLVDNAPKGADVADWQLGDVSLNTSFSESVTVQTMDGITVYVNGVALTDDNTIRIGTTRVEEYLPEGVFLKKGSPSAVNVEVEILSVQNSKTFTLDQTNLTLEGKEEQKSYTFDTTELTVSGEEAALQALTSHNLHGILHVNGLEEGEHRIMVHIDLPEGLSALPAYINVTISGEHETPETE